MKNEIRNITIKGAGERGCVWVEWEYKNSRQRKWRTDYELVAEVEVEEFIAELKEWFNED